MEIQSAPEGVLNNHFFKCFQCADLQFVDSRNAEIQSRE
jgi:hypothetical protein